MKYGSVCSGIEAATAAWHPLGWDAAWFSEIEPFPCAVLAHHYPNKPNLGDMTKYKEWPDEPSIDVLVGGTPCQSFSVAGLRKGLDDPRGNLMLTFGAIASKYRPRWLVWENVPGVLSSNGGRDFGTFLGMLGELGYGFAYRVLDAQYFGLAQRRRRVFVVGYLGDWRRAAAVLFERHSLSGHSAPSREAGKGITHDVAPSLVSSGRGVERTGESRGQDPVVAVPIKGFRMAAFGEYVDDGTASTAKARDYKDATDPAVTVALRGREGGATAELGGEVATALRASTGGGDKPHVLTVHGTQDPCVSGSTAFALGRNNGGENAVYAFAENSRSELRLEGGDGSRTGALSTGGGKAGQGTPTIATGLAVRRLTPRECERLQGFPDDFTQIPYRNKTADMCPDGPRYKALGNSMAVPVMRWIGERIEAVSRIAGVAQ